MEAIGLVSSIISFVDFSWKVFSDAREVYNSVTESTDTNRTLETVTNELVRLNERIPVSSDCPRDLKHLCVECHAVADELLKHIEKLKGKDTHNRLESFKAATKNIWALGKLDGTWKRLQRLQT